jgi:MFS family permease
MSTPDPSKRSLRALDALNLFAADVRDGLGPYLAVYLASRHWAPDRIGFAMAAMGIASVAAQTPAGAVIDGVRSKRAVVMASSLAIGHAAEAMGLKTTPAVVVASQAVIGVAAAIFPPAIAAVSLGLVGRARFAARTGRNESFNHGGNVLAAVLAGALGDLVAYEAIFFLVAAMSLATIASTLFLDPREIDHDRARGADAEEDRAARRVAPLHELLTDRRILIFGASVVLFHLANAAMLPLVGQKVTDGERDGVASLMSACIIAAQFTMVPVAILASRLTETWGRRPVFLIGFVVLPIRGFLYTLTTNPYALIAVQVLDGIGAGIFGVVGVLTIADLTRGTGRFNLMQGALATATGLGASASNLLAGYVVKIAGFDPAFLMLASLAAVGLVFYATFMPETRPGSESAERLAPPIPARAVSVP